VPASFSQVVSQARIAMVTASPSRKL